MVVILVNIYLNVVSIIVILMSFVFLVVDLLVGCESIEVDNLMNRFLDVFVDGCIIMGMFFIVGCFICVWVWGVMMDGVIVRCLVSVIGLDVNLMIVDYFWLIVFLLFIILINVIFNRFYDFGFKGIV